MTDGGKRTVGLLRTLWRYVTKVRTSEKSRQKQLVGEDKLGNKYYVLPADQSATGKEARSIEPSEKIIDKHQFIANFGMDMEIPVEWSTWLRGTRQKPPTPEEIEKNEMNRIRMAEKVRQLEMKDEAERLGIEPGQESEDTSLPEITKDISPVDNPKKVPFPKYGEEFEKSPGIPPSDKEPND